MALALKSGATQAGDRRVSVRDATRSEDADARLRLAQRTWRPRIPSRLQGFGRAAQAPGRHQEARTTEGACRPNDIRAPDVTFRSFQQLIRDMYLEKDLARGTEGTFMWLMEEVGELPPLCATGQCSNHDR